MIFTRIRQVIRKMLDRNTIKNSLGVTTSLSDTMQKSIDVWSKIYSGVPPWADGNIKELNLGAGIANEIARLVTLEMKSEVTGSERAEHINGIYQEVLLNIRPQIEKACALGGIAIKPYIADGKVQFDFADSTYFYPCEYDSDGDITAAVFVAKKTVGKKYYTKLEYHRFENNTETIINKAFCSPNSDYLGNRVELSAVSEWATLPEEFMINNIQRPLFVYFKMPFANEVDPNSPLGVSVFSRAVELLEEADRQWSRLLWEFEGGELAIDADMSYLDITDDDGNRIKMPQTRKRLFRGLNTIGDKEFYNVFSPQIRDVSYINGLNTILRRIEFNCSLAYGTLSDIQSVDKTAEEIKASKQRSFAAVSDIQQSLERTLRKLIYIIDVWVGIGKTAPMGDYEVSFEWDDSIVTDRKAEFEEKQKLVMMGAMPLWEFRMWYFGETEEQAKARLAEEVPDDEE